ncbi:hypothetical protein JMJ56_32795 [Belnapia sp. T18]|uniref:Uncharacterized protein n=1 Tax=Belnapia arida TaxID=2804533 RepID=A0ABS1UDI8_9PROT|nr:hypothetical protein [Belnapia arida]MBL6082738.1 hypothetical protein [Belnapia arida]
MSDRNSSKVEPEAQARRDELSLTALWESVFKSADVVFKLVSWLLIAVAVRAAAQITDNTSLKILSIILFFVYSTVGLTLGLFLVGGKYVHKDLPEIWQSIARLVGVVIGFSLFAFLVSPYLWFDQLVNALSEGLRR